MKDKRFCRECNTPVIRNKMQTSGGFICEPCRKLNIKRKKREHTR